MYVPCIKLFPNDAQLLCIRDKSCVVYAKQVQLWTLDSSTLDTHPRAFEGFLQITIFCLGKNLNLTG